MRYDLYYIKNRSIWLDAWILLRTVLIVIFGQGATEVKRRTTRHTDMTWSSVRTGTNGATYAPVLVSSNTRRPSSGRH